MNSFQATSTNRLFTSDNFLEHFTKETSPEAAQAPTEVDIVRVRKTVIKSYLKQISGVVRGRVVTIASDSCTNELISSNIYKQIVQSKQSKDKQTLLLLHSICKRVRDRSGKKFAVFLDLLKGCGPGGRDIVVDIKMAILRQVDEQQPSPTPIRHAQPQDNPSRDRPNQPVSQSGEHERSRAMMILGSGKTVDTKVLNPAVDPQKESEYFVTQDRKQNEEKIRDRELTEDLSKNQEQLGEVSQKKAELEIELTAKEREVTELENELETLRLAKETLRLRYADSEKKAAEIKLITTAISELETKISHVSGERKEIRTRMVVFEEKIQNIHTGQLETKQEMRDIQTTLLKMQVSIEEACTCSSPSFLQRHAGKMLSAQAFVICVLVAVLGFFIFWTF